MSNGTKAPYPQKVENPFQRFTEAVDGLMRVPHSAIKEAMNQEKQQKAEKKRAKKQPASVVPSSRNED